MRVFVVLLVCSVGCLLLQRVLAGYGFENASQNLLNNFDFENRMRYRDWFGVKCKRQRYRGDHYLGGHYSGKAFDRTNTAGGIRQKVLSFVKGGVLKQDTYYYFSIFIKFLNSHTSPFKASLVAKTKVGESLNFVSLGILPNDGTASQSWLHIGGDFKTSSDVFQFVEFYLKDIPTSVSYLLDKGSLVEIPLNPNWEAEADAKIQALRTNTITLSGSLPPGTSPGTVELKVSQHRHEFGFGSAAKSIHIAADDDDVFAEKYRNYFFNHFEWATLENKLKWKQVELKKKKVPTATLR